MYIYLLCNSKNLFSKINAFHEIVNNHIIYEYFDKISNTQETLTCYITII